MRYAQTLYCPVCEVDVEVIEVGLDEWEAADRSDQYHLDEDHDLR